MNSVKANVNYTGRIEKDITLHIKADLTQNDIFNWLTECDNPDTLRYLGQYALRCAQSIENPDTDDFRSRA